MDTPLPDPLHTRCLSLELLRDAAGRLAARGEILDLRKRGYAAMTGELQNAGIIHHMRLRGAIDPDTRVLLEIDADQPTVAFEPSPFTDGESCRDPVGQLGALAGKTLDRSFARALGQAYGGPRGCSHLLTLAQLLASTAPRALDAERAAGTWNERVPGERVFKRTVFADGFEREDGSLELIVSLTELHTRARTRMSGPLERLLRLDEIRFDAQVELGSFELRALGARERSRSAPQPGPFEETSGRYAGLVGRGVTTGFAAEIFRALPEPTAARDALLNLAPAVIQTLAAFADRWQAAALEAGDDAPMRRTFQLPDASIGGFPDSCYMWRTGGPMARMRSRGQGS